MMKKKHQNSLMSISASTSISVFPSRDMFSRSRNSGELSHYLFEDGISSVEVKTSERQEQIHLEELDENALNTVREYDDVDYLAATLRAEEVFMCVNCYESIPINQVDHHSIICCNPETDLDKIMDKVHKLVFTIREYKLDADLRHEYALIQLEEIGKSMCEGTSTMPQIFNKINTIIKNNKNHPFILILAQRLEKIVEGLSDVPERLNIQERNILEVIDSTLHASADHKSSFISMFSDLSYDANANNANIEIEDASETQEKYFYSLCIKKKLALGHSHSAKNISIFHLYQECLQKNVPVENWGEFVESSLGNQLIIIS